MVLGMNLTCKRAYSGYEIAPYIFERPAEEVGILG
jgi:hypothetical protein